MRQNKLHIATYQRDIYKGVSVAQHLHNDLPDFSESVVIRLGGTMPYENYTIQINSAKAVANSANKREQKRLLSDARLPTLPLLRVATVQFPCVVKGVHRSGGTSVVVTNNGVEFHAAMHTIGDAIIEPLFNTTSEYRLHCTKEENFFSVKKHKRNPEDIIINRDNHFNKMEFLKPRLWKEMQAACIKAMNVLDLDIAAFDVLYDSSDNNQHKFTIAEANTNPELLHNTYMKYLEQLTKLITDKIAALPKNNQTRQETTALAQFNVLTEQQRLRVIDAVMRDQYQITGNGTLLNIKL